MLTEYLTLADTVLRVWNLRASPSLRRLEIMRSNRAALFGAFVVASVVVASGAAFAAEPGKPTTFTKDVLPIFQEKCQVCHRPGTVAPMSLMTYEDSRPWARSIRAKVAAREMPPWHLDRTVGI